MKTLDITYDENYFKEQYEKLDKAFNAYMKAISHSILSAIVYVLLYFIVYIIPNTTIQTYIRIIGALLFASALITLFFYPLLMKDGNIPDSLDSAVALKETYDENPESLFMESKNGEWFVLLNNEDDELVYIPLQKYLKNDFTYETEIPKEWETLHISVTNDGVSTISFT